MPTRITIENERGSYELQCDNAAFLFDTPVDLGETLADRLESLTGADALALMLQGNVQLVAHRNTEQMQQTTDDAIDCPYSDVALSNIYTMGITSAKDPRQELPPGLGPVVPIPEARLLRGRLILEEAIETVVALGLQISPAGQIYGTRIKSVKDLLVGIDPLAVPERMIWDAIDGCCDLNYVLTGTMLAYGVPDAPHHREVCRANNAKFPGGVAIVDENGKYQKPAGWTPPDHAAINRQYKQWGIPGVADMVPLVPDSAMTVSERALMNDRVVSDDEAEEILTQIDSDSD